jgi:mannose-6-phosphate isomerase-like protein (cupin superfamily)
VQRRIQMSSRGLMLTLIIMASSLVAADVNQRKVDPTFLRRYLPEVQPKSSDLSTAACEYKPIFGVGDSTPNILRGVRRLGQITVAPSGSCKPVNYPAEEQIYVIMEGTGVLQYGGETDPVKKDDFLYLPAGIEHGVSNKAATPLRLFVMGFKVPSGTPPPPKLQIANIDGIKPQTVGGHPDSVVYQLMMGDTNSKRDRLASAHLVTSLFLMTFQPGGTNFPHHHDDEEEIYILLDGTGDMVAGSGMDGVEGRFPARPGDAYFFRLNTTVGFYNSTKGPAHILAVRSTYPRNRKQE